MTDLTKRDSWERIWDKHLNSYKKSSARLGLFFKKIPFLSRSRIETSLEIAAGSAKDSIELSKTGIQCFATDFQGNTLSDIKTTSKVRPEKIQFIQCDAFSLPFRKNSFDMSFHNGFFVLFKKNEDIQKLLTEQIRVTKHIAITVNHNSKNTKLVRSFSQRAQNDSLYDIRFFSPEEIEDLLKKTGCVKILKFGNSVIDKLAYGSRIKRYNNIKIPRTINSLFKKYIHFFYQRIPWKWIERIITIIFIKKP